MAITRAQQAKQLLNEIAPKGEKLAYINSREAKLLKKMGGAGIDVNGTGIKSYYYDAAGIEGATSGGSRDSGGYGGGSSNNNNGDNDSTYNAADAYFTPTKSKSKSILDYSPTFQAVKFVFNTVKGVFEKISKPNSNTGYHPGLDQRPLNKNKPTTGGDNDTPLARNVGGRILKLSPTTAEVSQSNATDTAAYDNRKTKARGRSMTILTSARGVRGNTGAVLGTKSLLGSA